MTYTEALHHAYHNDSLKDAQNLIGRLGYELQNSSIPANIRDQLLGFIAQYNQTFMSREIQLTTALKLSKSADKTN